MTKVRLALCVLCVIASGGGAARAAQQITVVNQAHVRARVLRRVEHAVARQSWELAYWWHTQPIHFGPGGWKLYLKVGAPAGAWGEHFYWGQPYGLVFTAGGRWPSWSVPFSHEIVEMLVDPTAGGTSVYHDDEGQAVEVVDPVERRDYHIDGVYVADFVLPSWYDQAPQEGSCDDTTDCTYSNPISDQTGPPYDHMRVLTAPWQVASWP